MKLNSQQFKYIIEATMLSTPEGFTYNSTRYPMKPTLVKKKVLENHCVFFTNILDAKKKTSTRRVRASK